MQKLIAGTKFLLLGWETALDYVLGLLNAFVASNAAVGAKIAAGRALALDALYYLKKFRKYCPNAWIDAYDPTVDAVETLVRIFDDGKVEAAELARAKIAFEKAYAAWRS